MSRAKKIVLKFFFVIVLPIINLIIVKNITNIIIFMNIKVLLT